MNLKEIQILLDPNELHSTPPEMWTDEDVSLLMQTRTALLQQNLANARGKFDRINCKAALQSFLENDDTLKLCMHRMRALRRLRDARSELESGNKTLALRLLDVAKESAGFCTTHSHVTSGKPDPATENDFLHIDALHEQLTRELILVQKHSPQPEPPAAPAPNPVSKETTVPDAVVSHPVTPACTTPATRPPEPDPALILRFSLPDGKELILIGREKATLGRSTEATVPLSVNKADHLDHAESNRRLSRFHLTIALHNNNDIRISDGAYQSNGSRQPSGNGSYIGNKKLDVTDLFRHKPANLKLISPNPDPGIPYWKLQYWKTQDCLPRIPTIADIPELSGPPSAPAALYMKRIDYPLDLLFVWTALPLDKIFPKSAGWIVRHQQGFLYLDKESHWHLIQNASQLPDFPLQPI